MDIGASGLGVVSGKEGFQISSGNGNGVCFSGEGDQGDKTLDVENGKDPDGGGKTRDPGGSQTCGFRKYSC